MCYMYFDSLSCHMLGDGLVKFEDVEVFGGAALAELAGDDVFELDDDANQARQIIEVAVIAAHAMADMPFSSWHCDAVEQVYPHRKFTASDLVALVASYLTTNLFLEA